MQFKTLTVADLENINLIEQATQAFPWSRDMLFDSLSTGCFAQGLQVDNELFAFCLVTIVKPEAEILTICVHKNKQQQGLGKLLLQYVIAKLKEQGIEKIFLEVRASNKIAINLYQRLGFMQIGLRKNYYFAENNQREDALIFNLKVDS